MLGLPPTNTKGPIPLARATMSNASARTAASSTSSRSGQLPGENLTLQETLRVMDVAREMREQRETAEEMFRHEDAKTKLREKLMRTARLSGDRVTAAEIDAAIDQYLASRHTYQDPESGFQSFLAHCWVYRDKLLLGAASIAAAAAAAIYFFV